MTTFTGFSKAARDFLRELPTHDKAWFDANRKTYDAEVAGPAKVFVEAVTATLQSDLSPAIVGVPKVNGSISPINRDIRFSADKTPYKDHLLMKWWEGPDKKTAPSLHVRVSGDDVGFATGAMLTSLDTWRDLIDDQATGAPLAKAITALVAETEPKWRGPTTNVCRSPTPPTIRGVTCSGTSGSRCVGLPSLRLGGALRHRYGNAWPPLRALHVAPRLTAALARSCGGGCLRDWRDRLRGSRRTAFSPGKRPDACVYRFLNDGGVARDVRHHPLLVAIAAHELAPRGGLELRLPRKGMAGSAGQSTA